MTPTTKRNAGRAPGGFVESGQQQSPKSTPQRRADQTSRPFRVSIVAWGKVREWGRFSDQQSADVAVSKLRRHGFDALAERVPR